MLAEILAGAALSLRLAGDGSEPAKPDPAEPVADAVASDSADIPKLFDWKPHPTLRFGRVAEIEFRARFQGDMHRSYDGADVRAGLETFELARRRAGIQGRLVGHIDFEVERELTEQALTPAEIAEGLHRPSPWKDVYVNVEYLKNAQVQAGRFKIPFGLDELTSVTHNDFIYRSLGADHLAPSRDIGVMAHGRFFKRALSYWTGVFAHDGDNARSKKVDGGNRTFAVRLASLPLRGVNAGGLDRLQIGAAYATTAVANDSFRPNGLRGETLMTDETFFDPVYVNGRRQRWEGDVEWIAGPASLRAEYTHATDDRHGQGLGDQDLPDARYRSWYLDGTYVITREKKTRPIVPRAAFLAGGIGAVELTARYEHIWCDSVGGGDAAFRNPRAETILPSGDRVVTLGVNWILNRWLTLQFNGIRERIDDAERNPVAGGAAFWSRALRLQFVL